MTSFLAGVVVSKLIYKERMSQTRSSHGLYLDQENNVSPRHHLYLKNLVDGLVDLLFPHNQVSYILPG